MTVVFVVTIESPLFRVEI